jgi:hypothetical protein
MGPHNSSTCNEVGNHICKLSPQLYPKCSRISDAFIISAFKVTGYQESLLFFEVISPTCDSHWDNWDNWEANIKYSVLLSWSDETSSSQHQEILISNFPILSQLFGHDLITHTK